MKYFKFSSLVVLTIFVVLLNLSCHGEISSFEYTSKFYKIQIVSTAPFIKYFSVDAAGNNRLTQNTIFWESQANGESYVLFRLSDSEVEIRKKGANSPAEWTFKFEEKKFFITSNFQKENTLSGLILRFSKFQNHTTLLGVMAERNKTKLPAVLHFPDMGTFQLVADKPGSQINYDSYQKSGINYISIVLPESTDTQGHLRYTFTSASVYPRFPGVEEEMFVGFRRNYLNLFQINPKAQVLANNSWSDPCAITLFLSSMLALKTPPLINSLTALDLLRMSIERYLNGMKGCGMAGYNSGFWENNEVNDDGNNRFTRGDTFLDAFPSLVISACNYIKGSKDKKWAKHYYPKIKEWMDNQMKRDYNHNGLVEYELSGNSGSISGGLIPCNWWDTIGYGHEDAFSNALTFEALNLMAMVAEMIHEKEDVEIYKRYAEKLKDSYFKTFFNPKTGVLAGWKSKDGKLHDYYFLGTNSMAVYYNLVPEEKVKELMKTLWNKMQEIGYDDFTLGLPGNLVSIRREDYAHHDPRWGGGEKEDGSDAFQRYENGGASINWSYFTLKAFKKARLFNELKKITQGILAGINAGEFQGSCANGMTKDWKTWKGECWGYEGYLCDGYLVLLALNPEDQ